MWRHIGIMASIAVAASASDSTYAVNVWTDTAYKVLDDTSGVTEQMLDVTIDWSYENYFAVWSGDHAAIGTFSDNIPIPGFSGAGVGMLIGNYGNCSTDPDDISFAVENFGNGVVTACTSVDRDATFPQKRARIILYVTSLVPGNHLVSYDVIVPSSGSTVASGYTLVKDYYNATNNRDIWIANTGTGTSCVPAMGADCATYVTWTINGVSSTP